MKENIRMLQQLFSDYDSADLQDLAKLYDIDAVFQDPVHSVRGLLSIQQYFEAGRRGLISCKFDFGNHFECGTNATLEWNMRFAHRRLRGGKLLHLDGCSVFTFDLNSGLVLAHRDYFDMGAMVYEHVPLLGKAVSILKGKLAEG